jgi:hypothetical protein
VAAEVFGEVFETVGATGCQTDPGAGGGQRAGGGLPDPGRGAGDERRAPLQGLRENGV